jgi:peptidylprolyl isomerase
MAQTGDPTGTGEGGSELPDLVAEFTFKRGADTPFVAAGRPRRGPSSASSARYPFRANRAI